MSRKKLLDFSSIQFNNEPVHMIWWMNIGVKETVENDTDHFFPQFNRKKPSTVTSTEQLCLFQAEEKDIVILRAPAPQEVMLSVEIAKGFIPIILYVEDKHDNYSESILEDTSVLSKIKELIQISETAYILAPFKITEFDYEIGKLLGTKLCGNIPGSEMDINDKIISRELCLQIGGKVTHGFDCYNVKDIQEAINKLSPEGTVVVKEFDGVSGQGFFIIHDSQSLKVFNAILRRHKSEEKFRLLVEKWYDNCVDLNYQIFIGNNGEIIQMPPTRQIINKGVYEGTDFQIEEYVSEANIIEIENFGQRLASHLHLNGYYGNISVDTIMLNDKLFHLVEINARLSLSSYYWGAVQNYRSKKIMIQYYNIKSEKFSLSDFYNKFCGKPDNEKVLVLSSGIDHTNETCRVFLMYVANEIDDLQFLKSSVEEFIMGEKMS
jgi:hypothetical protein